LKSGCCLVEDIPTVFNLWLDRRLATPLHGEFQARQSVVEETHREQYGTDFRRMVMYRRRSVL